MVYYKSNRAELKKQERLGVLNHSLFTYAEAAENVFQDIGIGGFSGDFA